MGRRWVFQGHRQMSPRSFRDRWYGLKGGPDWAKRVDAAKWLLRGDGKMARSCWRLAKPRRKSDGRRLPDGSRFVTVGQLFAMGNDERAATYVWIIPNYPGAARWMPVVRLLSISARGETSLLAAPGGMVVVARTGT